MGIQYSNDGETWDSEVGFGPVYSSTDGFHDSSSFADITGLGTRKRLVRFCILAKNTAANDVEYCDVRVQIQRTGA